MNEICVLGLAMNEHWVRTSSETHMRTADHPTTPSREVSQTQIKVKIHIMFRIQRKRRNLCAAPISVHCGHNQPNEAHIQNLLYFKKDYYFPYIGRAQKTLAIKGV